MRTTALARAVRRSALRPIGALTVAVLGAGVLLATGSSPAVAAGDAPSPVVDRASTAVTSTALPTAQINGIVWTQAVAGNTVFAGGSFTSARPPGAAAGTSETPRSNLLAYDITTGQLTSFAPVVNGVVQSMALSPDRSRLYIGGNFSSVDGQPRYRVAAFDVATGALDPTFRPSADYIVYSIAATASTVYLGGAFSTVAGQPRSRLAAVSASNGALLSWAPSADLTVRGIVVAPDGGRIIVAGGFGSLNGVSARGLGSLDPTTGATQTFAANQQVFATGTKSSFFSLKLSGNTVYGSAFNYYGSSNLEGSFAADATTGALVWLEDCHGDTYDVFPTPDQVYVVGHPHDCSTAGGYPDGSAQRALAFTSAATGVVQHWKGSGYWDNYGKPSPSLTTWFPALNTGTVSGSAQAAWSVSGDNRYVVLGGEFTRVNGTGQQGLVRFAVPSVTPDKVAPTLVDTAFVPTSTAIGRGALRLAFAANWDQDDRTLNYTVLRDTGAGTAQTTVWQYTATSLFWQRPNLAFADTGLTPGTAYRYRLIATDPSGNQALGAWTTFTAPASGSTGFNSAPTAAGTATVSADGASVTIDATASSDRDGMVSRYALDFGDGFVATTPTATHRYTQSGTYRIAITVTDDDGATATLTGTRTVTVQPLPPTAAATVSVSGLSAYLDGSGSTDPDGTVTAWSWDFGDGTTGSGATPTHVYAANGTYTVTLTVTDASGLTDSTTLPVTVKSDAPVAADAFGRSVTSGWGTADIGGTWQVSGGASNFAVDGSRGTQTLSGPGATTTALLPAVVAGDQTLTFDVAVPTAATGNGTTVTAILRRADNNDYRVKLRLLPNNVVHLAMSVVTGGSERVVRETDVPNLGYVPGDVLRVQAGVTGSGTNVVTGAVWKAVGGTAPASPQLSVTDTTAALAAPGAIGVTSYLSGSSTTRGVVVGIDDLTLRAR